MWTIIKYAIYIFIFLALFYFIKGFFDKNPSPTASLESSVTQFSTMAQQMIQNAYDRWTSRISDDVSSAYRQTEDMIAQAVRQ